MELAEHDEDKEGASLAPKTNAEGEYEVKRGERSIGYLQEALEFLPRQATGASEDYIGRPPYIVHTCLIDLCSSSLHTLHAALL